MRSAAPFQARKTSRSAPAHRTLATSTAMDRTGRADSRRWRSHRSRKVIHEMPPSLRAGGGVSACGWAMWLFLSEVRGDDLTAQPVGDVVDPAAELDASLLHDEDLVGVVDHAKGLFDGEDGDAVGVDA